MLGPPKARCLDRPVLVSLERLVPPGHFYRHLEADARPELRARLGRGPLRRRSAGRAIDPVVFFKLQLIMFFEGIRSERQLIETASLNLAHRWYLGYALDEPLPDHSSLSRIRARLGLPIFRRFFEHVVQLCLDAGLVWGEELFFDATKVRANAALDSVVPRLAEVVDGHLVDLFGPGRDAATPRRAERRGAAPAPAAENVIPLRRAGRADGPGRAAGAGARALGPAGGVPARPRSGPRSAATSG